MHKKTLKKVERSHLRNSPHPSRKEENEQNQERKAKATISELMYGRRKNSATFRYQDVGEKGHIQRLAGRRSSGSWDTQVWLISKEDAHLEGDTLIPDTEDARSLIEGLGSKPKHVKEDVFEAKDRPNVPESEKPTEAQQKARLENIKKAQQARRSRIAKKE